MVFFAMVLLPVSAQQSIAATISGTVTQYGGGAIAGATVRTEGEPTYLATTGTNGAYSLTLPSGAFNVLASASGYTPQRMSVPSGTGTVNFALNTTSTGSVSLPAPLTWGEPPSAPTAPGDSYPVAFASTSALPDPSAPRISEYNDCVKPDESFTLAGANFTTRTGADAGTDTTVWVWARTSSSTGTLRQARVWKASANTVVATIPDDVPFGMYMVWVENSVGASAPICINRTKALWIGPIDNNTYAGGTKRIFGRNLSYGHGTSQSYVYIQPASGGTFTQCPVTSVEPYAVAFTVPAGTANGNYKAYIHNGQGGAYGWGDALDLVVGTQWTRGTGQINITSNGTDDAAQIQSAINTVSGYTNGGIVQLGSGNYILKSPITIGTNVQLKGAGINSTVVLLEAATGNTQTAVSIGGNNAALTDLNIHEVYGYGLPGAEFACPANYSGGLIANVRIDTDLGNDNWQNVLAPTGLGVGTEMRNCEMYREVVTQWNCWVHDTNLYGDVGPWYNAEGASSLFGWNNVFEGNHAETLNWPITNGLPNYAWFWQDPLNPTTTLYYRTWAKRLVLAYCSNSYIAHNSATNVAVNDNRGEMILSHGHPADWCGQVLSNSGLTMTVRTDGTVFGQTYTIPNYGNPISAGGQIADSWDWWAYDAGRQVVIIAGTGAGQVRNIPNNGISAPNQITVDTPWTVQPDSTSVALFTGTWQNNIVYANDLSAFPVGFSFDPSKDYSNAGYASIGIDFDGNTYHGTAEANVSRRTNYGRAIQGNSGGPSLWCEMRNEQAIDCNAFGYRIMQLETNPVGPVLFGNAYRGGSGNVNSASNIGAAMAQGEGAVMENMNVTGALGYSVGFNQYGSTGSPTLYRNGSMTVNSSPYQPVYVNAADGSSLLIGNTYSGSAQTYYYNNPSGSYDLGVSSYSLIDPLYKVARFTASSGGGVLSAVYVPIVNGGTADMTWSVSSSASWISASIQSGGTVTAEGTSGSLSITPDTTGMNVGRHWGSVTVYTATGAVKVGVLVDITSSTQVAAPSFTPPADVAGSHAVTIGTATTGATIRYTTDGSTPTSSVGTVYSGTLTLNQGTVLKAIAYKNGLTDSTVTNVAAAPPTVSLTSGSYAGPQTTTISTITTGATIRYTTDGSVPSSSVGTVYSGPITISATCALHAIAYKTGMADSDVTNTPYTIVNQTWSLAGDFSSTTQGNSGWCYGTEYYYTSTSPTTMMLGASCSLYTGNTFDPQFNPAVDYWQVAGGIAYSLQATSLAKEDGLGVWHNGSMSANKVVLLTGSDTLGKVKVRWVAHLTGDYSYNVTFTKQADALNGVLVNWGDLWANTKTLLGAESYLTDQTSTQSYSGTQHLTPGQFLEFVVDPADANGKYHFWTSPDGARFDVVQVDATITAGSGSGSTVISPTFNPGAGTYSSAQSVTITSATNGATIRYTIDGSTPTSTSGTVYSGAVAINQNITLNAIAYKANMANSTVASGVYNIQVAAPTFSPAAGNYTGTQSVTISSTTSGATIRYTTDGSTPTSTTGTVYGSAVSVDQNVTLKAIAYKSGLADSAVTSGAYTINAVAPTFSPVAGTYTGTQSVTISSTTNGASIRYTTDGSTPSDTAGTIYSSAVAIGSSCTLKAITYKANMANSTVTSGAYTIQVVAPTFSPAAGTYTSAQSVTISSTTSGATIRYTTDGSTPTSTTGTVYSSPVAISLSCTLKAIAYKAGLTDSTVTSGAYTINLTPGWSLAGDFSSAAQGNRGWYYGATTYYTRGTDAAFLQQASSVDLWSGNTFDRQFTTAAVARWYLGANWVVYSSVADNMQLYDGGGQWHYGSIPAGKVALMSGGSNLDTTAARWVASTDGNYTYSVTFNRLVDALNGVCVVQGNASAHATTLLGSETFITDTNTSASYSGTVHLASGDFLQFAIDPLASDGANYYWGPPSRYDAIQVDATITDGGASTCGTPTFSPTSGRNYSSAQTVTISTTTSGASIRYTTDGSTPSDTVGTVYSGAVALNQNTTLKAIAYKTSVANSPVATGNYSYYIGNNLEGSGSQTVDDGVMRASRFQAGANITATQMLVDIAASVSAKGIKCAIYSDSSGNPGSLLMGTNELTNPGTGWKTFTLTSSQALSSGTYYWLVVWSNGSTYAVKGDSTGGSYKYKTQTYGTWPSSFGTPTGSGTLNYSIYSQ